MVFPVMTNCSQRPGPQIEAVAPDTLSEVRNAVEVSDRNQDEAYSGHDGELISSLFGPISIFEGASIASSETWRAYYEICLREALEIDNWADAALVQDLLRLTDLSSLGLPYQTLCRSLFDADPAALYLALYRCLEALYSYASANRMISALGLTQPWNEVAVVLERELGWRPREEDSLLGLVARADEQLLLQVFDCLGEPRPDVGTAVATNVTRRIYRLRNGLVHYRPVHHSIEYSTVDWNTLSSTISTIIREIYFDVHVGT